MNNENLKIVKKIIYNENQNINLDEIKNINDAETLHIIAMNYNWDNGLEIPLEIFRNEICDLSTALLLFYLADGYLFLENKNKVYESKDLKWKEFLCELYDKIVSNKFKTQTIAFSPPLSKGQIYKLRKINLNIPNYFFESKDGININISNM